MFKTTDLIAASVITLALSLCLWSMALMVGSISTMDKEAAEAFYSECGRARGVYSSTTEDGLMVHRCTAGSYTYNTLITKPLHISIKMDHDEYPTTNTRSL